MRPLMTAVEPFRDSRHFDLWGALVRSTMPAAGTVRPVGSVPGIVFSFRWG